MKSNNQNQPIFQTDEPSVEDRYKGQGHKSAACAMMGAIKSSENGMLIGLEGDLGAGKSSIISMLESMLPDSEYLFETFDVDTHSHSSIKASLIKSLYKRLDALNFKKKGIQSSLKEAKDSALGNNLTYSRETNSQISWFVVAFVVSIILSSRYVVDAFTITMATIGNIFAFQWDFNLEATVTALVGMSPILVLVYMAVYNLFSNKKITIADMFKRNGIDTINEKLNVTRDVGSIELSEALTIFVGAIPKNKKLILVIDNIDRVEARLVREIWSDLNILSALSSEKLHIIIPFSEIHIATALSDENDDSISSGREYISKRLPLVFRAPPIITAGWREQFYKYWGESIPSLEGKEETAELIDIWRNEKSAITPRFLKRLINDLASIMVCHLGSEVHGVSCASYLLAYKRNRPIISIVDLLSEAKENKETNTQYGKQLKETKRLLNKVIGSSEIWSSEIACVHYQTTKDIAQSELLQEPIKAALIASNMDKILELSDIVGFDVFFMREIEQHTPEKCYELLFKVKEINTVSGKSWVERWLEPINNWAIHCTTDFVYEESEIAAMIRLQEANLKIENRRVKRQYSNFVFDSQSNQNDILQLHHYSELLGETPEKITEPTNDLFTSILWPLRDQLKFWDVENLRLSQNTKLRVLSSISDFDKYEIGVTGSLFRWLSSNNILGMIDFKSEKSPCAELQIPLDKPELLLNIYLEAIPYSNKWGTQELSKALIDAYLTNEGDDIARCLALMLANGISSGSDFDAPINFTLKDQPHSQSLWKFIKPLLIEYSKYVNYLPDFLTFTPRAQLIFDCLEHEEKSDVIGAGLKEIIDDGRIQRLVIDTVLKENYENLSLLWNHDEKNELLLWLEGWSSKIIAKPVEWQNTLLADIVKFENGCFQSLLIAEVDSPDIDVEKWGGMLTDHTTNLDLICDWLIGKNYKLENGKIAVAVLKSLKSQEAQHLFEDKVWISKIICLLSVDDLGFVLQNCTPLIPLSSTEPEHRKNILEILKNHINLPKADEHVVRCAYMNLLSEESMYTWLDKQNWHLDDWDKSEIKQLLVAIDDSSHEYKNLRKKAEKCNKGFIASFVDEFRAKEDVDEES